MFSQCIYRLKQDNLILASAVFGMPICMHTIDK